MAHGRSSGSRSPEAHQRFLSGQVDRLTREVNDINARISQQRPGPYRDSLERKRGRKQADLDRFRTGLRRVEEDLTDEPDFSHAPAFA
jgi:hypothetical protein